MHFSSTSPFFFYPVSQYYIGIGSQSVDEIRHPGTSTKLVPKTTDAVTQSLAIEEICQACHGLTGWTGHLLQNFWWC